ncbi:hypothetical protein KC360_g189 [Hortaea werneckii]|nr:hypothetical protein KC360_g189 [Hortaea werneckii]
MGEGDSVLASIAPSRKQPLGIDKLKSSLESSCRRDHRTSRVAARWSRPTAQWSETSVGVVERQAWCGGGHNIDKVIGDPKEKRRVKLQAFARPLSFSSGPYLRHGGKRRLGGYRVTYGCSMDDDGEAIMDRVNTSLCRAHAWSISIKLMKHAPRNLRLLMRIVGFLNRELLGSILNLQPGNTEFISVSGKRYIRVHGFASTSVGSLAFSKVPR